MPKLRNHISISDISFAWTVWDSAFGTGSHRPFWKFLKIADPAAFSYWMTDEQLARLNMLNGPHAYTIIKAYKAKHKKHQK